VFEGDAVYKPGRGTPETPGTDQRQVICCSGSGFLLTNFLISSKYTIFCKI
jgi:hypothetical protein